MEQEFDGQMQDMENGEEGGEEQDDNELDKDMQDEDLGD